MCLANTASKFTGIAAIARDVFHGFAFAKVVPTSKRPETFVRIAFETTKGQATSPDCIQSFQPTILHLTFEFRVSFPLLQ